ncbi:hypothetical protein D3C87_1737420 [compost metagenome]
MRAKLCKGRYQLVFRLAIGQFERGFQRGMKTIAPGIRQECIEFLVHHSFDRHTLARLAGECVAAQPLGRREREGVILGGGEIKRVSQWLAS